MDPRVQRCHGQRRQVLKLEYDISRIPSLAYQGLSCLGTEELLGKPCSSAKFIYVSPQKSEQVEWIDQVQHYKGYRPAKNPLLIQDYVYSEIRPVF
jgi:hypothetical protein